MWTKNGKNIFLTNLILRNAVIKYTNYNGQLVEYNAGKSRIQSYTDLNRLGSINSTSATGYDGWGIFCGSGDTPPTEDDYTLAEPITLGYTNSSLTNTTVNKVIQYTVQNNNSEAVIIRELGLCYNRTYSDNIKLLANRKLLDTPITLAVGEQAIITFTVDTSNILIDDGWNNNFKILSCEQLIDTINTKQGYINVKGSENPYFDTYLSDIITSASGYKPDILAGGTNGNNSGYYSIYVGTGNTPPTVGDYVLEAPVQLTYQSASCTIDNNNNGLISYTLQNTTGQTLTIREICLCGNFRKNANFYNVMFNRKLLPTPVVMEPNDSYVFTYTINTSNLSE